MGIPIIFYHAVLPEGVTGEKYAIGIEAFRSQMEYIASNGYRALVLDDLFKPGAVRPGDKAVAISFDDGHKSDYSLAYPVLKELGLRATFFVTAGWAGTEGYVSWDDLREMDGAGMSVQSHSMTHSFMSDLKPEELKDELLGSKNLISEKLGSTVDYISLPGGFCSPKVIEAAEDLGYRAVCTSRPGVAEPAGKGSFAVFDRLLITGKTPREEFEKMVRADKGLLASQMSKYYLKTAMRKTFGSQLYYKMWSIFCKKA